MTVSATTSKRHPAAIPLLVLMGLIIALKAFWLVMGMGSVGATKPMMIFGAALVAFVASAVLLGTANRNAGIALAWIGVILAFVAGQMGGVTPGPDHSRFEEQYRNHFLDYVFLVAAHLQFWFEMKRERAVVTTP